MKKTTVVIATLIMSAGLRAFGGGAGDVGNANTSGSLHINEAGKLICSGSNPNVNKASVSIATDAKGQSVVTFTTQSLNATSTGKPNPAYSSVLNSKETEVYISYQAVNMLFGHHNSVIKLIADGDIFGGASDADKKKPYNGVLFFQSGNGDASISRFNVVCKFTPDSDTL